MNGIFVGIVFFALSWVYAIIEMIATHSFERFFFVFGIPVCKNKIKIDGLSKVNLPQYLTIKKEEGKFLFNDKSEVLFLSQFFFFRIRASTPFPVRSIGKMKEDDTISIKGTIPLGTSIFLLLWLFAWMSFSFFSKVSIFGLLVIILIFIFSFWTERNRINLMLEELKSIISENKEI